MTPKDVTIQLYRSVFGGPEGQRVLAHMLWDMGFFYDNVTDPAKVAVANYGKTILRNCGIFPDGPEQNRLERVIQELFNVQEKQAISSD